MGAGRVARKDQLQQDMQGRRLQIDAGLVACMQTREGRAFLGWLIFDPEAGRVDHTSFTQDATGAAAPLHTAFYEGRRAVGAALRDRIIKQNPEGWLAIQSERLAEERLSASLAREAAQRERRAPGGGFEEDQVDDD